MTCFTLGTFGICTFDNVAKDTVASQRSSILITVASVGPIGPNDEQACKHPCLCHFGGCRDCHSNERGISKQCGVATSGGHNRKKLLWRSRLIQLRQHSSLFFAVAYIHVACCSHPTQKVRPTARVNQRYQPPSVRLNGWSLITLMDRLRNSAAHIMTD